jgi:cytochrome P450
LFNYFSGKKWQGRRKFLTPAFHFKILEEYLKIFNTNSQILVEKLCEMFEEPFVDITSYISMCALDIICGNFIPLMLSSSKLLKYTRRIFELFPHHGSSSAMLTHTSYANLLFLSVKVDVRSG